MAFRGNRYQGMPMAAEQRPAFAAPQESSAAPSALASLKERGERLDQLIGQVGAPVKPYLPGLARFLIVSTFLEDALRLMSQWTEQVSYIWNVRRLPYVIAVAYLALNIVCMLVGSFSVILKKRLIYGVGALLFVVVSQAFVYGLIFDFQFFFRNLSLIGGLLLAVSDAFVHDRRALPGLPMIEDKDKAKYFQLAGRILLIFLFIAYMITKRWTVVGGLFNVLGLVACVSVVVGFQARVAASFLVVLLTVQNLITNPYWRYAPQNPTRDFLRYEHFQTLSIVGGLILLVSAGAGRISIDEKKKIY